MKTKWRNDVGALARYNNTSTLRPRLVMAVDLETECIRLPQEGEKDPIFGLTRSYLNTLILPSRRNAGRTLVRSFRLLRPGNKKGVRLIDLQSLRDYVHKHVEASEVQEPVPVPVARQIKEELRIAA